MIGAFEMYYPVVMSFIWIIGTLFFQYTEHRIKKHGHTLEDPPAVDVFVACYNEEDTIAETVDSLEQQTYSNMQIVLIDDKSSDNTLQILYQLKQKYENITVIAQKQNQGKAMALNTAMKQSKAKYILCTDADATFEPEALLHLVETCERDPKYAAVTGRPLIKNVTNIITALQFLEYLTNIDFIKRSQSFFTSRLYTVSGVLTLFRTSAVRDVGGWDQQAMTEDIDVTWRLYEKGYLVKYQPQSICYIYGPGTVRGFVHQRIRWARGGIEVFTKHFKKIPQMAWSQRLLAVDMSASYFWIFSVSFSFVIIFFQYIFEKNLTLNIDIMITYYLITLVFYTIARILNYGDSRIKYPFKIMLCLPLFFYFYWLNNIIVTFVGFYHVFDTMQFAAWGDSDRGL